MVVRYILGCITIYFCNLQARQVLMFVTELQVFLNCFTLQLKSAVDYNDSEFTVVLKTF